MSIHEHEINIQALRQHKQRVLSKTRVHLSPKFTMDRLTNFLTYHEEMHPHDVLDVLESYFDWNDESNR